MSPKRKAALEWFFWRGEIECQAAQALDDFPGIFIVRRMFRDQQLQACQHPRRNGAPFYYSLTDKGRRGLHEATS